MKTLHDIPKEYTISQKLIDGFEYLYTLGYRKFRQASTKGFWDLWIPSVTGNSTLHDRRGNWVIMVDVEFFSRHKYNYMQDGGGVPFSPDWIVKE